MPLTSREMHAPARATPHARARYQPDYPCALACQTMLRNTARARASNPPKTGTPQAVPGNTPVQARILYFESKVAN
ncbi:hypothetical protein JCGZ_05389 [Jatropha curcas]|uniref:Uncharacterized protein n=1 Tax=Jatropha curcas TaxID=180498 RepID=A0A067L676_JATCU|nr:hypothetical protein JCGZ_05389 [Jatropha curcas]